MPSVFSKTLFRLSVEETDVRHLTLQNQVNLYFWTGDGHVKLTDKQLTAKDGRWS